MFNTVLQCTEYDTTTLQQYTVILACVVYTESIEELSRITEEMCLSLLTCVKYFL